MLQVIARFQVLKSELKADRGASLVEYALLVAGMAIVVAAVVLLLGDEIADLVGGIFP